LQNLRRRSAGSFRLALPTLIVGLSLAGFVVTSATIDRDREATAERRAELESVRTQGALGRLRAYVHGLGNVLASEPAAAQRNFVRLAGSAAGSFGLVDAAWVRPVAGSERATFERRLGAPITRPTGSGTEPAPPRARYLVVTFATSNRPGLRRGLDVSGSGALGGALRDPASAFAVVASRLGSLGDQPGFYVLEAGRFGRGPDSRGTLAVFVPRGWLTVSLDDDPRRVTIRLGGRRLDGELRSPAAAGAAFEALGQRWSIGVGREPESEFQSLLPWLALVWPATAALLAFLVARGITRRRRAERETERIFELSLDLLCIAGLDGYFKRVNPAVERALGYSSEQLLSRPFLEFVHPHDRERTRKALEPLARGEEVAQFENRYVRSDGSDRWLEWSTRPLPDEGLVYAAGRDVTDRRRAEEELRHAQRIVESSRDELRVLADEQAALRRVATLVAEGVPPPDVLAAVAEEVGGVFGADATIILRFDQDGAATVLARRGAHPDEIRVGSRWTLEAPLALETVLRTGRAARLDDYDAAPGAFAAVVRRMGIVSSVASPIVVEGRLWGAIGVGTQRARFPDDTEQRMVGFTELIATAIANADSRAELTASRARVVAAADETRRRIERDLHDGTQQRLVALALAVRAAEAKVPPELGELRAELSTAASGLAGAAEDLQEISRGIHPAILSKGGLGPALRTLARRAAIPVELDARLPQRLPERVEVAAYYVISEALTNAAKHAEASVVHVSVVARDTAVELTIRDDGIGGADPDRGSGIVGLRDRVAALGGTIDVASGPGRGTSLVARIPLGGTDGSAWPHPSPSSS
jgi:PAS domain S-box-containing protein